MITTEQSQIGHGEALAVQDVAELLGVSERHVWSLHSRALLPAPARLGRSVRWVRSELLAWLDAKCPGRERWEAMRRER